LLVGASKTRTRLTLRNGEASIQHGPYASQHELPASTLFLKVTTRDEAIGLQPSSKAILGGTLEVDVRLVE
jgi:hypothetical protein